MKKRILPFGSQANLFRAGVCVYGSVCGLTLTLVIHPVQYQTSSRGPQQRPQEGCPRSESAGKGNSESHPGHLLGRPGCLHPAETAWGRSYSSKPPMVTSELVLLCGNVSPQSVSAASPLSWFPHPELSTTCLQYVSILGISRHAWSSMPDFPAPPNRLQCSRSHHP